MTRNKTSQALVVRTKATKPLPRVTRQTQVPISRARAPQKTRRVLPEALLRQICGITDPFCSHALGAKLPDNSNIRTFAFPVHTNHYLTTDANGNGAMLVLPSINYESCLTAPFSIVGTEVTFTNARPSPSQSPQTGTQYYRMVSCGYKISSIVAPLVASGLVQVRNWPQDDGSFLIPYDGSSYLASESRNIPLSETRDFCVIMPRSAKPVATFYSTAEEVATGSLIGDWTSRGWTPSTVLVTGAPASTTVLHIEWFCNIEITMQDSSPLAIAATMPPPYNPTVTASAQYITSLQDTAMTAGTAVVGTAIRALAVKAVAAVSNWVAPGSGAITAGAGQYLMNG